MSKLLKEFREFAVQGNMIDMAVGMIIGAAFKQYVYLAERRALRDSG